MTEVGRSATVSKWPVKSLHLADYPRFRTRRRATDRGSTKCNEWVAPRPRSASAPQCMAACGTSPAIAGALRNHRLWAQFRGTALRSTLPDTPWPLVCLPGAVHTGIGIRRRYGNAAVTDPGLALPPISERFTLRVKTLLSSRRACEPATSSRVSKGRPARASPCWRAR